MSVFIDPEISL